MEWRILVGALVGAGGWWAGGRGLPPFRKLWRRVVFPLALGLVLWSVIPLWRLLFGVVLMMVANSLPYGESHRLRIKVLTALALGACLLPFGLAWWQAALVPMWFGGNYLLSRISNRHSWKFTEVSTGCIQGALAGMAQ